MGQQYQQETFDIERTLEANEKATFNLSKETLRSLENAWFEIRRIRGDKKVSKTDIVEQAIEVALFNFFAAKHESQLYCNLAGNKKL